MVFFRKDKFSHDHCAMFQALAQDTGVIVFWNRSDSHCTSHGEGVGSALLFLGCLFFFACGMATLL